MIAVLSDSLSFAHFYGCVCCHSAAPVDQRARTIAMRSRAEQLGLSTSTKGLAARIAAEEARRARAAAKEKTSRSTKPITAASSKKGRGRKKKDVSPPQVSDEVFERILDEHPLVAAVEDQGEETKEKGAQESALVETPSRKSLPAPTPIKGKKLNAKQRAAADAARKAVDETEAATSEAEEEQKSVSQSIIER